MSAKQDVIKAIAELNFRAEPSLADKHLANAIEALIDERIKEALWENRLLGADEKHVKRSEDMADSLKVIGEEIAKLD